MDAQHRADLDRILANRRAGGRLKAQNGSQSLSSPPPPPPSSSFSAAQTEGADNMTTVSATDSIRLNKGPRGKPQPRPLTPVQAEERALPRSLQADANEVNTLQRQVSELQRSVEVQTKTQSNRLDELLEDIRAVHEVLVHPTSAESSGKRQHQHHQQPRTLARSGGMTHHVPRMVPQPSFGLSPRPVAVGGPGQREAPPVVDFADRFRIAHTRPPAEPPLAARPYATTTLDVSTSVALLRRGDWFFKWSKGGSEVKRQFVWLDTTSYMIQWGSSQKSASVLSNFVKIEEIMHVTTSEIVEHHDTKSRVFHVLFIHTPARTLRLGTEIRQKLDVWYEALNNIIAFYRTQNQLSRRIPSSSD
jgi:hypothetical protein